MPSQKIGDDLEESKEKGTDQKNEVVGKDKDAGTLKKILVVDAKSRKVRDNTVSQSNLDEEKLEELKEMTMEQKNELVGKNEEAGRQDQYRRRIYLTQIVTKGDKK